jgi:class 3 adenylate cyclase
LISFWILGPIEARAGQERLAVDGRRQLSLLAFLLLNANRAVSSDRVRDAIWGPARSGADNRLQMAIARLRRALEPRDHDGESMLRTVGGGYMLSVGPGDLDAEAFTTGAREGRRALEAGEASRAAELLTQALGLWRGPPLAEVAFEDFAQPEIRRLQELRLVAIEARVDAELQLGRQAELIGELEALVTEQPARERLAAQLMLALYHCGRQADALQAYQRTRTHLAEELGLEPGPALKTLQTQILEQASSLDAAAAPERVMLAEPALSTPTAVSSLPAPAPIDVSSPAVSLKEHRKTVTVLFIDIVDSTALGAKLDPEALHVVMRRYYAVVRAAIEEHGGVVQKFIGDAVVALFGVPAVHEDDALRAVRAGVQAGGRLSQLNVELGAAFGVLIGVRTGINTGEVLVGGHAGEAEGLVGDVLNVAARLEQRAGEGEVLLGEATYALVSDAIRAERVEPLAVKGKSEPLAAYRLLELTQSAGRPGRRRRAPLVGRGQELRLILDADARARGEHSCHLFTVLGPAGVGKSRLIEEAAAACDDAVVLSGRCLSYGEGITFWPLAEILRTAAGIREGDGGEETQRKLDVLLADDEAEEAQTIASILAAVIGVRQAAASVEESFWAARRLLESIARRHHLIVVFEDVHWAEPTLLDLIEHVAEMSRGVPMLIVCVARPELLDARPSWGGGKRNATSIHLEPLSGQQSVELIEGLLPGATLPPEVSARIAAGSEGFPLFVEEMIGMLVDEGLITSDRVGWAASAAVASVPVPPSIRALLTARLDGLAADQRRALEFASVVGLEFWQAALAAIAPDETEATDRSVLCALVRKDLIVPERSTMTGNDSFRFRHILIRDAVYDSLPKAGRAELHERFADWLEGSFADRLPEVQEIIGYHLEQAHTYRTTLCQGSDELAERAAVHLGAAGRRALTRTDTRAASTLLERARSLIPVGSSAHSQLGLDLGTTLFRGGDFERARTVLQEVEDEAEASQDMVGAAHARVDLAQIRIWADPEGAADNARREADEAMPLFQHAADNLGVAKALILGGDRDGMLGRYASRRESYERALKHLRKSGDRVWVLWVLGLIADSVTLGPTPIPEAIARMQDIVRETGSNPELRARVLACTGLLRALQGWEQEALAAEAQAEGILRDLGVDYHLTWLALYGGNLRRWLGRLDQAEQLIREVDEIHERSAERSIRSTLLAQLSQVLIAQGRIDEANRTALHAIEIGSSDDALTLMTAHGTLARVLARKRDPEAEPAARRAVELAEQTDALWVQGEQWEVLAEALLGQGRRDDANAAFRTALDRFDRKAATAPANRVRGRLQLDD